jgi:hypothetical protein
MTCEEAREWLSAEMDGEGSVRPPALVRQHVELCAECGRFRNTARELREQLAVAKCRSNDPDTSDESILVVLRQEGLASGTLATGAGRFSRLLRGRALIAWPCARPALAAMTAALIITWGSLHWAETCPSDVPLPASHGIAGAAGEMPDTALLDRWLNGPPTMAALSRLRRELGPGPAALSPTRRSAVATLRQSAG